MCVGDVLVQKIEGATHIDQKRTAVCSAFNAGISVPLAAWYAAADKIWPGSPSSSPRSFVTKVIVNQVLSSLTLSPGFLAWSNSVEALLNGRTLEDARRVTAETLRREGPSLVTTSFFFWLPTNSFMFFAVPQELRIAFLSTASCAWGAYTSYVAHRGDGGSSQDSACQS